MGERADRTRIHAVVLAGGRGTRFGGATPKQFAELAGRPLFLHSLERLDRCASLDALWLVAPADQLDSARTAAEGAGLRLLRGVVAGGDRRDDSTRRALGALGDAADDDYVLLHDAARPFPTAAMVDACVEALASHDAVTVAVAMSDTVVEAVDGVVVAAPDRERVWRVQTPQAFRLGTLRAAHRAAAADPSFVPTDDCGVVRRYLPDVTIRLVPGDESNLKVTTAHDLQVAAALVGSVPG